MAHPRSACSASPSRGANPDSSATLWPAWRLESRPASYGPRSHQGPGHGGSVVTPWLRRAGAVGALVSLSALGGCSALSVPEPWVKPFERERLADPVMKPLRDPMAAKHREHVLIVREGARGANGVQGGGCGCN